MTSVLKLFTAKEAMSVLSEGVESFGGIGYMENSKIPCLLRDGQVNNFFYKILSYNYFFKFLGLIFFFKF